MPQLLKPKLSGACALQREATAMRSPHNTRKRNPCSPQLEKAPKATKTAQPKKRNGESLWSIRTGVLSPSAQRDVSAEGRLRAISLGAIAIGRKKADESLNWALQYKGWGRGVKTVCARRWTRHRRGQ